MAPPALGRHGDQWAVDLLLSPAGPLRETPAASYTSPSSSKPVLPAERNTATRSRVHRTVTSSGLATLTRVTGQAERTGDLLLDESRDRPVVVLHALEVDAQPDEAVTGAVPGVPLDTLVAVRGA